MTSIDTNVSNYSLSELLAIVNLQDTETVDPHEIVTKTNKIINKFKNTHPELSVFFKEVQGQLLQYAEGLMEEPDDDDYTNKIVVEGFSTKTNDAVYPLGEKQITDWYENENLTQSDQNQVDKITQRKQKIQLFGNNHVPMNQEQIATTDTYALPVKQDSLNPNLKNTISRFVNLDSQFRQYTSGVDSASTNYTLDLSDTLKNALSLRLYSYQIPFSWYTIDNAYNNTCFWIVDTNSSNSIVITVPPGNYSQTAFQTQLGLSLQAAGFSNGPTMVNYNANSGILTLLFFGQVWVDPIQSTNTFTVSEETMILFYDFTGTYQCTTTCYNVSNHYFNNTLGWLMGFRIPYVYVTPNGNSGGAILDLNGPKYLILVIDDYNQNHVNNSLVSISQFSNTLKMPSYYSPDLPYTCISPEQQSYILEQQGNSLSQLVGQVTAQSLFDLQTPNPLNGLLIGGKYKQEYTSTQQVLPSAPRTLTQSQLYTINQINNNGNNVTNYLSKAPTSSDILGVIPVKTSTGVPTGSLLVEFSGSLQDNVRTYFGPVNIERMAIKLLDDKGNILNLNGNDWCVTLVCECLYQY
jgi:hypothetical protein